ncbi:MAG: leucine-rich repeat domain-containing protein [Muribaculaceae bacterium]|nr:leucine-rich repeat domain-containing protein [Muribaculaceae bacterium]
MKRNLLIIFGVLLAIANPIEVMANTSIDYLNTTEKFKGCLVGESVERIAWDAEMPQVYNFKTKSVTKPADQKGVSLSVQTKMEGELATVIGDKLLAIESLTVTGPINDVDFSTMWRATFEGNLQYIDLKDAVLSSGQVPNNAFFHKEEQIDTDGSLNVIMLKKIILPDNVKTIGDYAFYYSIFLESINIPSSLMKIGKDGFYNCWVLNFDELTLPEGFETLENGVFAFCRSLTAKVNLPATIKDIKSIAFYESSVSTVNLPSNLQTLGGGAFFHTNLKEIFIPDGCVFEGTQHFAYCSELERVHLPEGITNLPLGIFFYCSNLTDVNIPESVTEVNFQALGCCYSLSNLRLPNSFKKCLEGSLCWMTSLEEIYFPASTETIGEESCIYWQNIKKIYSAATTPPVCEGDTDSSKTPFGDIGSFSEYDTPRDTPVYVPVGTAEAYRNAWGWNYFTNFIETDEFPASAVDEIMSDEDWENMPMFDLYGRKVENPQRGQIYVKGGKKFIQN